MGLKLFILQLEELFDPTDTRRGRLQRHCPAEKLDAEGDLTSANAVEPNIENAMTAITRDLFVFMREFIDVFDRLLRRVRGILRYH